jgi:Uma2 family endonuclease
MSMLILDKDLASDIKARRLAQGLDKHDEVWEGATVVMPWPNNEHQDIVNRFSELLGIIYGWSRPHFIFPGVNISDRPFNWKENFRCPDFVVYLQGNPAVNYETFWHGPDFLIEVASEDDGSRDKLPFYASVNTREVLIIDRDPWTLELYQLQNGNLVLVGESTLAQPNVLPSSVLPISFQLIAGSARPAIRVSQVGTAQNWTI